MNDSDLDLLKNWKKGSFRRMAEEVLGEEIDKTDLDTASKLKRVFIEMSLLIHPDKVLRNERSIALATEMYLATKAQYEKALRKLSDGTVRQTKKKKLKKIEGDVVPKAVVEELEKEKRLALLKERLKKQKLREEEREKIRGKPRIIIVEKKVEDLDADEDTEDEEIRLREEREEEEREEEEYWEEREREEKRQKEMREEQAEIEKLREKQKRRDRRERKRMEEEEALEYLDDEMRSYVKRLPPKERKKFIANMFGEDLSD